MTIIARDTIGDNNSASAHSEFTQWDLDTTDRIGPPVKRRSRRLCLAILMLCLLGGGWTHYADPSILPRMWTAASKTASPAVERVVASFSASPAPPAIEASAKPLADRHSTGAEQTPPPLEPAQSIAELPKPGVEAPTPAAPANASEPEPAPNAAAAPEALPLPPDDVLDELGRRAKRAGLNPSLSRTLLSQLTDADFRNATHAIRTALATTQDDGTFAWPRERKPGLAIFEVRFVKGAPTDCRRYVVIVERNRWLTTAQPIETCGSAAKRRS